MVAVFFTVAKRIKETKVTERAIIPNHVLSIENIQEKVERSKQLLGMLAIMTQVYIEKRKKSLSPPVRSLLENTLSIISMVKPFATHPLMMNSEICSLINCAVYSATQWSLYPLLYASMMALSVTFVSFILLATVKNTATIDYRAIGLHQEIK